MCKSKEEKSLSKDEKREALEQMLQTNFPAKAMTVLATFGTIIAVATIALQIVGMARKVKYWYIGKFFNSNALKSLEIYLFN